MDLSAGSAKPTPAAIRRCASLVEFSLITVNATCPGLMCFSPSLREISLQFGGKMEETRTILQAAMPALRSASSKLESRSRCLPTPLVRKIFFATNAMYRAGLRCLHLGRSHLQRKIRSERENGKKLAHCQCDFRETSVPAQTGSPSRPKISRRMQARAPRNVHFRT